VARADAETPLAASSVLRSVAKDTRVMERIVWVSQINSLQYLCLSTSRSQFHFLCDSALHFPAYAGFAWIRLGVKATTCKAMAKDLTFKAKAKDLIFKAKAKAKDLTFKAKAKDLILEDNKVGYQNEYKSATMSKFNCWHLSVS